MQDKFIDIITEKGDKLIVSLCCNYPFIKDCLPEEYRFLDIIEISIDRIDGENSINIKTFENIARTIIGELKEHPEVILYYFCNISSDIPNFRASRNISAQKYRNTLFRLLFLRYTKLLSDPWQDVEIEMQDPNSDMIFYIHILIRESQLAAVEPLTKEIAEIFDIISATKEQD